jgi:hypothetical protein
MGSILTREYHLRTLNFRRYNFCGPNTRLNNRLNPDRTPKNWSKPINRVDEICMRHDLGYRNGSRREADEAMLRELNELENSDLTCNELLANIYLSAYFIVCVVNKKCPRIQNSCLLSIAAKLSRVQRCHRNSIIQTDGRSVLRNNLTGSATPYTRRRSTHFIQKKHNKANTVI